MFEIKNIRSDDLTLMALTEAYLLTNPHPGVRIRPGDEIRKAMSTGQCLVIESDGAICGCSLIYKFDVPQTGPIYSEIGTMRITANGYDLQTLIAKLHLVQIYLEEYRSTPSEIFAVVEPKTASEHNLVNKVLLKRWPVPPALSVLRSNTGVPFSAAKYAIAADTVAIERAFRDLAAGCRPDGTLNTPKNNGQVKVAMGWFSPSVLSCYP